MEDTGFFRKGVVGRKNNFKGSVEYPAEQDHKEEWEMGANIFSDRAGGDLQVRFYGFPGEVQFFGDLYIFAALVSAEDKYFFLLWRELADSLVK